jgi:hypothetical protein
MALLRRRDNGSWLLAFGSLKTSIQRSAFSRQPARKATNGAPKIDAEIGDESYEKNQDHCLFTRQWFVLFPFVFNRSDLTPGGSAK